MSINLPFHSEVLTQSMNQSMAQSMNQSMAQSMAMSMQMQLPQSMPSMAGTSAASTSAMISASIPSSSKRDTGRLPEECQVCGTGANVRKNFGVPSCVSCRIFYSRNTGKQLICYQNGNCRIVGPSRKSCASCRFNKCVLAGMQKSRERKYKYKKIGPPATAKAGPASVGKQQHRGRQPALSKASSSTPTQFDEGASRSPQQLIPGLMPPLMPTLPPLSTLPPLPPLPTLPTLPPLPPLMAAAAEEAAAAPPLGLLRDLSEPQVPLMDRDLFVHFYKLADMFCMPFEAGRDRLTVRDTNSGLGLLEAVTKRTLSIIRFLPYFGDLDKRLMSAMVSEKISGLITILRALHYHSATGIMTLRCAPQPDDSATEPISFNPTVMSRESADCLQQPLIEIINNLFGDLTKGETPLISDAEVATVYLAAARLYEQCHCLFRDRINIGIVLLLGMYLFLPDFKSVQTDERQLRGFQSLYLRCLQDLLKALGRDAADAMDMYNRILFLLTEVKSVDFYLSLLSRHVRMQPS